MESIVKRNFRSELKKIDWDFTGENGSSGLASYHWYPARFVPQLPGILINYFSSPGDTILDPFCGSGTTLVESYKIGRKAVGVDINPVAVLMTKAKLVEYNERSLTEYVERIRRDSLRLLQRAGKDFELSDELMFDIPNPDENSTWYSVETLNQLGAIWSALQRNRNSKLFVVGLAAFSAILKYSCSQDKHWGWICDNVKPKKMLPKSAMSRFNEKLEEFRLSSAELNEDVRILQECHVRASDIKVIEGPCEDVLSRFQDRQFDLVVTSPPYYNMTDYIKSQRLTLLWLSKDVDKLRSEEIGARFKRGREDSLVQYLAQMKACFMQVSRVLTRSAFCCVVIGESPRYAPFLDDFRNLCKTCGLKPVETLTRRISKQRSLSPILHKEQILILRKI